MRTFDRATFLEAKAQWDTGRYGWRWQGIRRIAAERGFIYPPSGSVHDDRDSENPSQRAIVYSALEDNPTEVERIVRRSRSWSDVVNGIIGMDARLRSEEAEARRDVDWQRRDDPTHRDSVMSLGAIVQRIGDSQ